MITEPLTDPDHLEVRDMVADVAARMFTSERVRAAVCAPLGYDEVAWDRLVELGWTGLGVHEDAGGAGLGCVVQCVIHRELGSRLAPSPYLATAGFAAVALATIVDPVTARPLLTAIAEGTEQFAVVLGAGSPWAEGGRSTVTATGSDGSWTLTGRADLVLDGARASSLVVVAATESRASRVFLVAARDVDARLVATVDSTRSVATVTFGGSAARALGDRDLLPTQVAALGHRMAVLLAAEMVGAAAAATRHTLDFLRTRHQFGRPIGSFQALKHRMADTAVAVTVAQELVFSAAALVDSVDDTALVLAAPLALARAGEVFKHASEEAIQLHGGVGFTDEVDIGLYYKRALVDLELLASPAEAYALVEAARRGAVVSP